ncbi:MAG TPA: PrgI family protein [Candidatus Saccharimonadales bacterium]|nr:PrgI family protein [Candidatus Saccharimonadales bacterium]
MATYKVIQDVEAEDKLLGPLTLRQFIYAAIAAVSLYLTYLSATHGVAFFAIILIPVAIVSGFFAYPWGRDQPTEVWALAKIRFLIKPRRRIWDQSGAKQLVQVTAPKQVNVDYTNGLSVNEVESRLRALADTIDSRGWVIKNANLNSYAGPPLMMQEPSSDRLVTPMAPPQAVESVDIRAADDMLDEQNNPTAQHVDSMIAASSQARRQKLVDSLKAPAIGEPQQPQQPAANNYWFLNQPAQANAIPSDMVTFNTQVVTPGATEQDNDVPPPVMSEEAIVQELKTKKQELPITSYYSHLHTIQPLSAQAQQPAAASAATQPIPEPPHPASQQPPVVTPAEPTRAVTPAQQAAILQLSTNDDLNVATLAREASRAAPQDEVVIKLH